MKDLSGKTKNIKIIDKSLILESLKAAKNRAIGSFLTGNDDKGWMLTSTGLKFSKNSKNLFSGLVIRKKD